MNANKNAKINISPKDYSIIIDILANNLTDNNKVYAFGSRVNGKAQQYSDLDLLVYSHEKDIDNLRQAFDESSLGFKVDVIEADSISKAFFDCIKTNMVAIVYTNKLSVK